MSFDNTQGALAQRREAWRQRVQTELDRILCRLREQPDVVQVILFGSIARGDFGARSDLDLAIIQQTERRFLDRLDYFYGLLIPTVELDILVYTPEEWRELRRTRPFIRNIAEEGKVLYERAAA